MDLLIGTAFLLLVLVIFTLFTYKAPNGMRAMGALANAAIATFLVEAFNKYVGGQVLGISFLEDLGDAAGGLGGVAAAGLTALAIGVSPVYALVIAAACGGMDLLPGFFAGYIIGYLMKYTEKYVPDGVDLIGAVIIVAPLARLIALGLTPIVNNTLVKIGDIIQSSTDANPVVMGIVLGGIITVVGTAPLSSMALTALLGLTGVPMAIGAMAAFSSAFMNGTLFHRLKLGNRKDTISVSIEPLSQADIVSANPIPVYITNFLGGASAGLVIALSGLINDATGTATPIAGFLVMFGFNDWHIVILYGVIMGIIGLIWGFLGSMIFKNYPVVTKQDMKARGVTD
ncbi:PTS sugar transporter subunit IIC [Staphylococcus felis]|uniref:PTS sugar transporter subunit IIC n=2 Tax=Staphylococcus felis TaxID=46127 RepID=A0AAX1RXM3_9STAP|nr:transcriptional regulator [Staphylococcus felis]MBH9581051.1 PTS sugar transporter subunit IIC [Staphylococcus felis]PNZ34342.1 transcriptional regulator [Staphylococcus felis]QQB03634.1 PTS sugar transporter subunit IIC [Staphylococcus felis]REH76612.1 PTS sugar transporter subunit IIC [Staphylococcus felis]